MKKRILFIAPSLYPVNGPESMVNAKHVRLLIEAGCDVDVVTRGVRKGFVCYPSADDKRLFEGVGEMSIISVDTKWNLRTFIRHIITFLYTSYIYKGADWSINAILECKKLMKRKKYDYVFTKDYPSEIVGLYFAKRGFKWIGGWNDPYMWVKYPAPYGKGYDCKISWNRKKIIADIGKYCYKNVFPSRRLADYMLKYMTNMSEESCVVMPHILLGNKITYNNCDKIESDILRIIHTGSVGKERNPYKFLSALNRFVTTFPDAKVQVTFLGIVDRAKDSFLLKQIDKLGLSSIVEMHPPISKDKVSAMVNKYNVCMLIEAPVAEGIFLPSKIIDYIEQNKVIFAVSPKIGTIRDMYEKRLVDYIADVEDEDDIYAVLIQMYEDLGKGKLGVPHKDVSSLSSNALIQLHYNSILV